MSFHIKMLDKTEPKPKPNMNQSQATFFNSSEDEGEAYEQPERTPQGKKVRNKGGWSYLEDMTNLQFLVIKEVEMETEEMRRGFKVFEQLSKFLNYTRSANQCRSHHEKMLAAIQGREQTLDAYVRSKHKRRCEKTQKQNRERAGKMKLEEGKHNEQILRESQIQIRPKGKKGFELVAWIMIQDLQSW